MIPRLIGAARVVDGVGDLAPVQRLVEAARGHGLRLETLRIAALDHPWEAPPDPAQRLFKSGCAPILALARARALLHEGAADVVRIEGREPLRTGYDRAARQAHMAIWPGVAIPEAYTALAEAWMARHGIDETTFRFLSDRLLANYGATVQAAGQGDDLAGKLEVAAHLVGARQKQATRLFTYADCAHPDIDFEGAVLLGTAPASDALLGAGAPRVRLLGVAVETVADGPAHAAEIAAYAHLGRAYAEAVAEAGVDFAARFLDGRALLEAYTCFPPVPLGFLLATGLAAGPEALAPLLAAHPITVTGGMNLGRAPWNNPVLNALVVMHERLAAGAAEVGLLHGNGGLGGWQGVAVLGGAAGD